MPIQKDRWYLLYPRGSMSVLVYQYVGFKPRTNCALPTLQHTVSMASFNQMAYKYFLL